MSEGSSEEQGKPRGTDSLHVTVENVEKGQLDVQESKWTIMLALLAVAASFFTLAYTFFWNSSFAQVQPVEPSGMAIVRGINPRELEQVSEFPGDHIVLLLEWTNKSGASVLVKNLELVFRKLGPSGERTGEEHRFFLVGEYPDISANVLNEANFKMPTYKNSIVVEPHSVSQLVVVFREANWKRKKETGNSFHFSAGEEYQVDAVYERLPKGPGDYSKALISSLTRSDTRQEDGHSETLLCYFRIPENAKYLSLYGRGSGIGWDYWSFLPGATGKVEDCNTVPGY